MNEVIAVIDDNHRWLETVAELLANEGFQVCTARAGPEAIELLATACPHLIILDVNLPVISGLHVLHEFRQRDAGTPVLMVSAEDQTWIRQQAMDCGASGFLSKPVSLGLLLHAVHRFLNPPSSDRPSRRPWPSASN